MICVFIVELVKNSKEQGSPVSFKVRSNNVLPRLHNSRKSRVQPTVNYMLGPSSAALINVGARFPACMKDVAEVPPTLQLGCEFHKPFLLWRLQ